MVVFWALYITCAVATASAITATFLRDFWRDGPKPYRTAFALATVLLAILASAVWPVILGFVLTNRKYRGN